MPMSYFNVNGHNLLHGTMRKINPMYGWIWIKLLALCSQSRVWGIICANDEAAYDDEYLAFMCGVSVEEYKEALAVHAKEERVTVNEWGGIAIVNWDNYQSNGYARVAKHRAQQRKNVTDVTKSVTSETKCNKSIEEKRREEKRKEKKTNCTENDVFYPSKNPVNQTENPCHTEKRDPKKQKRVLEVCNGHVSKEARNVLIDIPTAMDDKSFDSFCEVLRQNPLHAIAYALSANGKRAPAKYLGKIVTGERKPPSDAFIAKASEMMEVNDGCQ